MIFCRKFIFSMLLSTSCFAAIKIEKSEVYESRPVETVVELLESCYGKRITPLGLIGHSTEVISKILWSQENSAITLIDATSRIVSNYNKQSTQQYKLQVFVVTASSPTDLTTSLGKIKASIYWNHMATFLILQWPLSDRNCSRSFEMLWSAWEMNILNAKFICHHQEKGQFIYTYNPFTSFAPFPWQMVKIYKGNHGHPWTLFAHHLENLKEICNSLHFDKTNNLGGYKINVSVTDLIVDRKINKTNNVCVGDYEQMLCDIIFPALNAKPNVLMHSINSVGYVDKNGKPHGILKEVINGHSDVGLLARYITSLKNVPISYPYWQSSLHVMTQHRGYKSQLNKIVSVVDSKSRYFLIIVCLINIILFRYFLNQPIIVSCLNTLRLICNIGILKKPEKFAPRIYLTSLLLFVVTMHGIYEGQLASLLTKQEPLKNVNTKEDLISLGYTVYGSTTYAIHFKDPEFQGRFVELEEVMCTEYVLKNRKTACVGDLDFVLYDAAKFKLYLSTESLVDTHMALPIRPDWPLENRVNKILRTSLETHSGELLHERIDGKQIRDLQIRDYEMKNQGFRVLNLEQLSFVFAIIGIGLGFATLSFFCEILIPHVCSI